MRKITEKIIVLCLLALVLSIGTVCADSGKTVFYSDFELENGQRLVGDLMIIGGETELEKGSVVAGDVYMIGGDLEVGGVIEGDLTMLYGDAVLEESARVEGDVSSMGGTLTRKEGAVVLGDSLAQGTMNVYPDGENDVSYNISSSYSSSDSVLLKFLRIFTGTITTVIHLFLTACVAAVVMLLLDKRVAAASEKLSRNPWKSLFVGSIALILIFALLFMLFVTLIGIPLALVLLAFYLLLRVYAVIIVGYTLGNKAADKLNLHFHPILTAVLGTILVQLLSSLCQRFIPCLGWLADPFIVAFGLGAVVIKVLKLFENNSRPKPLLNAKRTESDNLEKVTPQLPEAGETPPSEDSED